MLTPSDLKQIEKKGISPETINNQIRNFESGFPYSSLIKPATVADGLIALNSEEAENLANFYQSGLDGKIMVKFVPASGAASRMFKALFEYLENADKLNQDEILLKEKGFDSPFNFINRIKDFAFFEDLQTALQKNGFDLEAEISSKNYTGRYRSPGK